MNRFKQGLLEVILGVSCLFIPLSAESQDLVNRGSSEGGGGGYASTNAVITNLTQDININWNWKKQCFVDVSSGDNGSIDYTNGWENEGKEISFEATPDQYYVFGGWTGTTSSTENPLTINVDKPYSLGASFNPALASDGTPHYWLASYGYTNDFEGVINSDDDGDGYTAGQEYVCGTSPVDGEDYFSTGINNEGFYVLDSKTNRSYSYDSSTNLSEGFNVGTNWISGNGAGLILDDFSSSNRKFYRGNYIRR